METNNLMKGQCLCGKVSLTVNKATDVEACHCGMCQRWGGGPLLAIHCGTDVKISNEDRVSRYDSSEWAERGFCSSCGTHLFYHFKPANSYAVPAGLFHEQPDLQLKEQIFVDRKPDYYDFANHTPMLTEAQVMEKFGQ